MAGDHPPIRLIAGTANPELAQEVSDNLGVPLSVGTTKSFADGAATIVFTHHPRVRCLHASH
jgi:phosphoribosylpyrophosphate synthetase